MDDHFKAAIRSGYEHLHAKELLADYCRNGEVVLDGGTSAVGAALGLPIGMTRVRCDHAPPSGAMSMHPLDLAVSFYESNCVGCPHRDPTGRLPTIADESAERKARAEAAEQEQARLEAEAIAAWERRRAARRNAVATEGYTVRDIADDLDHLDRRPGSASEDDLRARRQVVEVAHRAPGLFNDLLAASVVEMAVTLSDPTACVVIRHLARAGQVDRTTAVSAGVAALSQRPTREAGQLVAELADAATTAHVGHATSGAVALCREETGPFSRGSVQDPVAILALARRDIVAVADVVVAMLGDDDPWTRAAAADAARFVLTDDPRRVTLLGAPLVSSIRGEDGHYSGDAHPGGSATRALAESWRGMPEETRAIIEQGATALNDDALKELGHVVWHLDRWDDDTPVTDEAFATAVEFALTRATGDWGGDPAYRAAEDLKALAKDSSDVVARYADGLIGLLLTPRTGRERRASGLIVTGSSEAAALAGGTPGAPSVAEPENDYLAALEAYGASINDSAVRREVAEALGIVTERDPETLMPKLSVLVAAESGDPEADSRLRSTLLSAMTAAVTSETVGDVLPTMYTSLLGTSVGVRTTAIDLWVAIARCTATLPRDLYDLAPAVLTDEYQAVHSTMVRAIPRLGLPPDVVRDVLPTVEALVSHYDANPEPMMHVVEDGLRVLLWAGDHLDDDDLRHRAVVYVTRRSSSLRPYLREGVLLDSRIRNYRATTAWVEAALEVFGDLDYHDRYNHRDDRLLAALLETPNELAAVPVETFVELSAQHLPTFLRPASDPVCLLQSAGRWSDAVTVARAGLDQIPDSVEHAYRRWHFAMLTAAAQAEAAPTSDGLPELPAPFTEPTDDTEGDDEPFFVQVARARHHARSLLASVPVAAPVAAADACRDAADLMRSAALPGRDLWLGKAFGIAADVLACDAAIRSGAADATTRLATARRNAQLLAREIATAPARLRPSEARSGLDVLAFATMVAGPDFHYDNIDDAIGLLRDLPHRLPLYIGSIRHPLDPSFNHPITGAPAPLGFGADEDDLGGGSTVPTTGGAGEHATDDDDPAPPAVCVLTVDGDFVSDTVILRDGQVYDLGVSLRLASWPDWADGCRVSFLSVHGPDAVNVSPFTFGPDDVVVDEFGVRLEGAGSLQCNASRRAGAGAFDLAIHVRFFAFPDVVSRSVTVDPTGEVRTAEGGRRAGRRPAPRDETAPRTELVMPAGVRRLLVRPHDASRDLLVGHPVDERLHEMYARLHDDLTLDTAEVQEFCRFFTCLVRAGLDINFDQGFRAGTKVNEAKFHNELEARLAADLELEGRLTRRDPIAGGFDDLKHDRIVAELKVVKRTAATLADSGKWAGQPAQYAAGIGSRLSILVVLDHSVKKSPTAVPQNYVGWAVPELHGVPEPTYPSLVGTLIIQTHWKLPSSYSRGRVPMTEAAGHAVDVHGPDADAAGIPGAEDAPVDAPAQLVDEG